MSALQCQNWHKHRDYQCDRAAGHDGPHTTERRIEWTDEDGYWTTREPDEPTLKRDMIYRRLAYKMDAHQGYTVIRTPIATTPPDEPEPTPATAEPARPSGDPILMAARAEAIASIVLRLGRTNRITLHPDATTPESVTDHTVMLAIVAAELAPPRLDRGNVLAFAVVHDLVEAYAGDTPTLVALGPEARAAKDAREAAALDRIRGEVHPDSWVVRMIEAYERQDTIEARWVHALDKCCPKLTHILNGGASVRAQGVGLDHVRERVAGQLAAIGDDLPEARLLGEALLRDAEAAWITPATEAPTAPPSYVGPLPDAGLKRVQLEREIRESGATALQKSNMMHTLTKLWMFATESHESTVKALERSRAAWDDEHARLVGALGDLALAEDNLRGEAPTAPSEPDEGAVSPAGTGEAVRPRAGAWVARDLGRWRRFSASDADDMMASVHRDFWWIAWQDCERGGGVVAEDQAPTLDAAKAAADAALEAAGYVLEGGAHVDMADDEAARARAFVARARAFMAPELAAAQGARLTEARDARDEARALLDRIAEALGYPGDWREVAGGADTLVRTAADAFAARRHADEAREAARRLRCEPGDVAGAALALQRERDLARGEAAGLERALRVLAEVRRG